MKKFLLKLLVWALRTLGREVIPNYVLPYLESATKMAKTMEKICAPGTSGEYKRHVVYAQLIKNFPEAQKRHLAMAIEYAVAALKG